jgi:D-3-phosphoglycerate dehydrogenase
MRKVLVTDSTFGGLDVEKSILEPVGCTLQACQCTTPGQLIEVVTDADFILTQFAPVTASVITAARRVRLIVRYGIGVDNVDIDAAQSRGIPVCNVPDYCIDEVADHTLALILASTRKLVQNNLQVRTGPWALAVPLEAMQALRHRTVGVIGFGRIGRAVVQRLSAFGCRVLVLDPAVKSAAILAAGAEVRSSLEDLLPHCDVLTLHCPATAQTRRMIGREALARLPRGSILVNTSRGSLVDTEALVAALAGGMLGAAALDVCDPEPLPADHPLLSLPNVLVTPHVASTSPPAVRKLRETAAHTIAQAIRGEALRHVVNGVRTPP